MIRNVSKFFFICPPKNILAQDEASLIIAGSIHETQNVSGKSEQASAVLIPIDEDKKGDEDDEEGPEEVALDWWSKYFTSKVICGLLGVVPATGVPISRVRTSGSRAPIPGGEPELNGQSLPLGGPPRRGRLCPLDAAPAPS